MNQRELESKINHILETLSQKRSAIISDFRKKLEEKGIEHVRNNLNQQ